MSDLRLNAHEKAAIANAAKIYADHPAALWEAVHAAIDPREEAAYRRAGDDLIPLLRIGPLFWRKVDVQRSTTVCWEWQGAKESYGYGQAKYEPFPLTTAHRMAWALTNGRMPEPDEVVRHICDNPPCCNPNHLLIGTQVDNMRDMVERGRAEHQRPTCRKGHLRTPANTKYEKDGSRRCVECEMARTDREPWTCDVCEVTLTMERHKKRHYQTKQHQYKAALAGLVGTKDGDDDE